MNKIFHITIVIIFFIIILEFIGKTPPEPCFYIPTIKKDLKKISAAIKKYNIINKKEISNLSQLPKEFIDNLKDNWNNSYIIDTKEKIIFSKGFDKKAYTKDDIILKYKE